MQIKFKQLALKAVFSFLLIICSIVKLFAHSPDLSSLMIYEQNGKHFLAIKSSLTAFEGEIDYHYGKNAYKTPEEFQQLVIKYFQKKCSLTVNDDTIKFIQPTVILGHETTVFVELPNLPQIINTLSLKNELFKELSHNQCELILMIKGYPQKQYILKQENLNEVELLIEKGNWTIVETTNSFPKTSNLIIWAVLFSAGIVVLIITIRKKKNVN